MKAEEQEHIMCVVRATTRQYMSETSVLVGNTRVESYKSIYIRRLDNDINGKSAITITTTVSKKHMRWVITYSSIDRPQ